MSLGHVGSLLPACAQGSSPCWAHTGACRSCARLKEQSSALQSLPERVTPCHALLFGLCVPHPCSIGQGMHVWPEEMRYVPRLFAATAHNG